MGLATNSPLRSSRCLYLCWSPSVASVCSERPNENYDAFKALLKSDPDPVVADKIADLRDKFRRLLTSGRSHAD
jgi:hypothetical protein